MRPLPVLVAALVAALGVGAAVAIGSTTGNVACATTPAHTVAVDGSPVSTTPGDVECATAPTVTVTVTGTTTTATTTPTTTTTSGGQSYDQAISYTQTRPPFTPLREVDVASAAALKTALSNLRAGDLVKGTASFTVSSSSGTPLTISNRPASPAEIDLTGVSIAYTGSSDTEAVDVSNASNLYIFGGDITTGAKGGMGMRVFGSQNVLWWGWKIHDTGDTGLQVIPAKGPTDHDDFQGEITNVGLDYLAYDPHPEKGTGLHAANLWDSAQTNAFTNNRFAFYAHDIPVGACVEFGNDEGTAGGNILYLKCVNETDVATSQTGGNALQLWGKAMPAAGLDVKYLEGDNLQGEALRADAVSSSTGASGVTVEYGRASNTNQNPKMSDNTQPWDTKHGVVYQDVQPAP
jgi:hypothetical protein